MDVMVLLGCSLTAWLSVPCEYRERLRTERAKSNAAGVTNDLMDQTLAARFPSRMCAMDAGLFGPRRLYRPARRCCWPSSKG